jgi:hypothetical protein
MGGGEILVKGLDMTKTPLPNTDNLIVHPSPTYMYIHVHILSLYSPPPPRPFSNMEYCMLNIIQSLTFDAANSFSIKCAAVKIF